MLELNTIGEAIENAGFHFTLMPLTDSSQTTRLVCASERREDGLHGNHFWIVKHNERWYLGTWTPRIYILPSTAKIEDIVALCLECFPLSRSFLRELPAEIVAKHRLKELDNAVLE